MPSKLHQSIFKVRDQQDILLDCIHLKPKVISYLVYLLYPFLDNALIQDKSKLTKAFATRFSTSIATLFFVVIQYECFKEQHEQKTTINVL